MQLEDSYKQLEEKLGFAAQFEELSVIAKKLEDSRDRAATSCKETEQKASFLEERLPPQAVEEFKASREFNIIGERQLSTKMINLFESLTTQIQEVDARFPLDRLAAMYEFLSWKKRQVVKSF